MSAHSNDNVFEIMAQHEPEFNLPVELRDKAAGLVKSYGYEVAARMLGHDVSDYRNLIMAGQLLMTDLATKVPKDILEYAEIMANVLNDNFKQFIFNNALQIQKDLDEWNWVNYRQDYVSAFNFIAMYLARPNFDAVPSEMPTMMMMRIAIQFHFDVSYARVRQAFIELCKGWYVAASPTMFNSGMIRPQLSSCFLMTISDNTEEILMGNYNAGMISRHSGGLGIDVSEIRHSQIGNLGKSKGIVPLLTTYNSTIRYINQGGRRKGAATIFLRPHHIDIFEFVNLVDPIGDHYERAHDLNLCIWMPWIFWKRVRQDGLWTLFCPRKVKNLRRVYGLDFERLYVEAELNPAITEPYKRVVRARDLLDHIVKMQRKAGQPYIMHCDSTNFKSNHKHIGYIRSGNLCVTGSTRVLTEIGYVPIKELEGREVRVWNGTAFSTVSVKKTGEKRPVVTVFTDDGQQVTCTPNHQFLVDTSSGSAHKIGSLPEDLKHGPRVMAIDLLPDTKLQIAPFPVLDDPVVFSGTMTDPYFRGVAAILGHYSPDNPRLIVLDPIVGIREVITKDMSLEPVEGNIFFVPMRDTLISRLTWLAGLFDAALLPGRMGSGEAVFPAGIVKHANRKFLLKVQSLLQTLGCRSALIKTIHGISLDREAASSGQEVTDQIGHYSLAIHAHYIAKLFELGLPCRYIVRPTILPDSLNEEPHCRVVAVINNFLTEDTYCFHEPQHHTGIFNGIFTGQCLEIVVYTDKDHINVCILTSMSLRTFVREVNYTKPATREDLIDRYDFEGLAQATWSVVENLDKLIDHNYYPLDLKKKDGSLKVGPVRRTSNKFRNIGIGVQGLADAFAALDLCFEDDLAGFIDEAIFACLYFNSLASSVQQAIFHGPCEVFAGSPFSQGHLQFDLWRQEYQIRWSVESNKAISNIDFFDPIEPTTWKQKPINLIDNYGHIIDTIEPSWKSLKSAIVKYGTRHSQLLAVMPTASSSLISRNSENVEKHLRNLYSKSVLNGDFPILNRYMYDDLFQLGLWNQDTINYLLGNDGVLTGFGAYLESKGVKIEDPERLAYIEKKYRTQWEISQRIFLKRAAARGKYIDGSQSTSISIEHPSDETLRAIHMYTDTLGLKTGSYYLREKAAIDPAKFNVDVDVMKYLKERNGAKCDDHSCCQ